VTFGAVVLLSGKHVVSLSLSLSLIGHTFYFTSDKSYRAPDMLSEAGCFPHGRFVSTFLYSCRRPYVSVDLFIDESTGDNDLSEAECEWSKVKTDETYSA